MKSIYAVNSGEYSSYCILALFSTMELAKEFMASMPNIIYNDIEVFDLDPDTADLIKRGYSVWRVLMLRNGDTEKVIRYDINAYDMSSSSHYLWKRSAVPLYAGKNIPDCLDSKVLAKTQNEAVKIVNEHRIQMIASGEW